MPILYKNAKKAVNKQYDEMIANGYVPTLNADKETYSWVNKNSGAKYYGTDPIGGIDAEAGVGDILKRNRRQRRLMSEKAGAVARENAQKISVQTAADSKSSKELELEKRIKLLEEAQSTKGTTKPTDATATDATATVESPTAPTESEPKIVHIPGAIELMPQPGSSTTDVNAGKIRNSIDVGYYTGTYDPTVPYVYVEDKDLAEVRYRAGLLGRVGNFVNSVTQQSAEAKHRGSVDSMLGLETGATLRHKITENGKSYTLMPNPDFKSKIYKVEDLDYIKSLYGKDVNILETEIDGKKYLRVNPNTAGKVANALSWIQNAAWQGMMLGSKTNLNTIKNLKVPTKAAEAEFGAGSAWEGFEGSAKASAATKEATKEATKGATTNKPVNGQYEFDFEGGIPAGKFQKAASGTTEYAGRTTTSNATRQEFKFRPKSPNEKYRTNWFKDGGKIRFNFVDDGN